MAKDEIKISFKVFNEDFKNSMSEMKKSTTELNREFKLQKEQMRLSGSETDKLKSKLEYLNKRHEQAKERVRLTQEQLNKAKSTFGENSEEVRKLEGELKNAKIQEQQFANKVKTTSDELNKASNPINNYKKKLNEVGNKLKNTGTKMKDIGKGMTAKVTAPIIAAGVGLVGLATKSGQAADRLLDLKEITGLTTDSLQEWRHVATVAGVSQDSMTSAIEGFVRKLPQLEAGTGKSTEQLKKLGLSYDDLKNKSPDEQFDLMINKLADMEDPLERNAIGSSLFGGAWKELAPVLGMGAEEIQKTRDEAHSLGNVLSEDALNDANNFRIEMDKMKESIKNAALKIGADLAPILRDNLVPLIRDTLIPKMQEWGEKIKELIQWFIDLSPKTQKFIGIAIGLLVALGPLLVVFGVIVGAIGNIVIAIGPLLGAWAGIKTAAVALAGFLKPIFATLFGPWGIAIAAAIAAGVLIYKNWDLIKEKALQLKNWLVEKFTVMKDGVVTKFTELKEGAKNKFNEFKTNVINPVKETATNVKNKISEMKTNASNKINSMKDDARTKFNQFKSNVVNPVKNTATDVKNRISTMKNDAVSKFESLRSSAKSKFDAAKSAIVDPINTAKDKISTAIDKIKGFFSGLKLKIPKFSMPKMPRFKITGEFSWKKKTIPKIGVSWKSEGAIFRKPTVFGGVGVGDAYRGTGNGMEAVLPISKLAGMIRDVLPIDYMQPSLEAMGDIYLTVDVPLDGETIIKKTIHITAQQLEKYRKRKGR
ncbi:hypothetical protein [Senegalia massiliensis]|uniref:hypothetical protein n=1 Tax=Senegalia massiliensis TaxID=1720316 RepID=UPI00102FDB7D|nr:hypothetical protein [Senegalia massiliensis]